MIIPVHFKPRDYQQKAIAALEKGVKRAVWCWARRGGKDMTAFAYAVKKMVESPVNVALVFPTKEQGREAFWNNIENDGFKTIEHIPLELIARRDNNNMKITLRNGSTFSLLGATDIEALRGANAKLYILSEFVDIPSDIMDVIEPVVNLNGGQIIIQSTPKIDGISGYTFQRLFNYAKDNPKTHYASRITAEHYMTEKALEEVRREVVARNGDDFKFRQEYLCDWGQTSQTSYYGSIIARIKKKGNISKFPYDPSKFVYTAWDLGISDSTAIVFFQYFDHRVRIIDYFETNDIGTQSIVRFVLSKQYNYYWHFFPHDGSVREFESLQRIEKIREMGMINSSLLRKESVSDGIDRVISWLPKTDINRDTTAGMIEKLLLYKRKFNPITGNYVGPEHKTESHCADSVRYLFVAIDQEFNQETCQMYIQQEQEVDDGIEIDSLIATSFYRPS